MSRVVGVDAVDAGQRLIRRRERQQANAMRQVRASVNFSGSMKVTDTREAGSSTGAAAAQPAASKKTAAEK